ncbi:Serine/Threonine-Protein Phosphatase 4 Regulatory Subunit 4, partial [Manis pentadactyla]
VLGTSGVCGRQNDWLGGCKPREVSNPREVSITTKEQRRSQSLGQRNLMKILQKFLSLPDMVREEEETSTVNTRDEEKKLEDV